MRWQWSCSCRRAVAWGARQHLLLQQRPPHRRPWTPRWRRWRWQPALSWGATRPHRKHASQQEDQEAWQNLAEMCWLQIVLSFDLWFCNLLGIWCFLILWETHVHTILLSLCRSDMCCLSCTCGAALVARRAPFFVWLPCAKDFHNASR